MFVALAANLTILPALITLMGSPAPPPAARAGAPARLARAIENHPRAVIASALALTLAAGLLAPWARFDFDPLNLKDRRTESVSTLFDLMADSRTSPYSATVLAPSLDAADALARRLLSLDPVESTATLSDYVPAAQTEKLEIIDAMSFFLAPALSNRDAKPPPGSDKRAAALTRVRERLAAFAATSRDAASRAAAERLSRAFDRLEAKGGTDGDALASLERRLIALFPERIRELGDSLAAEPFARADLPDEIKRRAVAADGRARLEIYPKENLHDREALERFVSAVRAVAPDAIGSPVVILEAGNTVVGAVRDAAVLAFVVIAILMGVLLRSVRDALFVFAPLVVAAVLTVAASVLLRLPFDFANVIVLPLLFGLGVANGVHLVVRGREDSVAGAVMGTSTPRAVVFSALTTVGSFGTIALSSHPGTAGMGCPVDDLDRVYLGRLVDRAAGADAADVGTPGEGAAMSAATGPEGLRVLPLIRWVSRHLTPVLARLPVTANQVTAASLVAGPAASAFVAVGGRPASLRGRRPFVRILCARQQRRRDRPPKEPGDAVRRAIRQFHRLGGARGVLRGPRLRGGGRPGAATSGFGSAPPPPPPPPPPERR